MNNFVKAALAVVMTAFSACSRPEPDMPVSFEPVASIPVGRASSVSFSVGGKGYVLCGRTGEMGGYLADFWEYDPKTDEWKELPAPPFEARVNAVAQVVGEKVFVGLGYKGGGVYRPESYQHDWWIYDPRTGEWDSKADYPSDAAAGASSFVAGDDIMVCFGTFGHTVDDVYAYSISGDSWRKVDESGDVSKMETIAGTVGGRHFAGTCAGWDEYVGGRWEKRAVIRHQEERMCASAVVKGESLYMLGGRTGWRTIRVFDEVWEYMPGADRWRLRGFLPGGGRENLVAFEIDGEVYVGTGEKEGGNVVNDFYKMIIP